MASRLNVGRGAAFARDSPMSSCPGTAPGSTSMTASPTSHRNWRAPVSVSSRYDQVTNPYEPAFQTTGPGTAVHNITLQDDCDQDMSDRLTRMYSPRANSIALSALDPAAYPNPVCTFDSWFIGGGGAI
ncbi:hypothetical protein [Nocardia sp. NPDC052112]|uniref:hypothetical protein n=1 Tax=Nocardia sp. NPDC052112 TaxID=3155646 RepID=UPI00344A2A92